MECCLHRSIKVAPRTANRTGCQSTESENLQKPLRGGLLVVVVVVPYLFSACPRRNSNSPAVFFPASLGPGESS